MKISSISNSKHISEKICEKLGVKMTQTIRKDFKDTEFTVGFEESIRGEKIFIIGSTNELRGNKNLMELCMLIRAAKSANAKEIIVIIPFFGWGQADRKDLDRSCVTAKLVADFIEISGATQVVTFDLHAVQVQSFFNIASDHILYEKVLMNWFKNQNKNNDYILAAPDTGAAKKVQKMANQLECDFVIFYKNRNKTTNQISNMEIFGDVLNKNVILCDDIINTGGTLCEAAKILKKKGAKKVFAYCSHAVLASKAVDLIETSDIDKLLVTDSIYYDNNSDKIEILSCDKIISNVINRINNNLSLSDI